jgi:hypothetical protein
MNDHQQKQQHVAAKKKKKPAVNLLGVDVDNFTEEEQVPAFKLPHWTQPAQLQMIIDVVASKGRNPT